MHDDVTNRRRLVLRLTFEPRVCGQDAPLSGRYPIHEYQQDHGIHYRDTHNQRTRSSLVSPVPVSCRLLAGVLRSAASPPRTFIPIFLLRARSYINVKSEPRPRGKTSSNRSYLSRRKRTARGRCALVPGWAPSFSSPELPPLFRPSRNRHRLDSFLILESLFNMRFQRR